MTISRPTVHLYAALDEDAQLAAAIRRRSVATAGERPMAGRAVRAAAIAAGCRALGCALRGLLPRPGAARPSRPAAPAAPGA